MDIQQRIEALKKKLELANHRNEKAKMNISEIVKFNKQIFIKLNEMLEKSGHNNKNNF